MSNTQQQENASTPYVTIMAGGIGSRFWPASRIERPKQFLDILGVGKSLLRLTFERFLRLCPREHIFVVTNSQYKELVKEQLPELTDRQVLCEPSRNNTAPCIAYTAFKLHQLDPAANLIVSPSDHVILQETDFVETLRKGLAFTAEHDALLTLGVQPSRPDTGYGYIKFSPEQQNGVHQVVRFTEKPPLEKALEYLAAGDYLWNAGIFIWRVDTLLHAFQQYAGDIYDILAAGTAQYNTPDEQSFIDRAYPGTPNISIDYAILEKAGNVYTIPSSFGWSDLGTWASLHAELPKDATNNAVFSRRVLMYDVRNCLIRAPEQKLLILKGLDDFIIVDEQDVLLIYPKSREQEIKSVTEEVRKRFGEAYL